MGSGLAGVSPGVSGEAVTDEETDGAALVARLEPGCGGSSWPSTRWVPVPSRPVPPDDGCTVHELPEAWTGTRSLLDDPSRPRP
jgi:hypothetical protein